MIQPATTPLYNQLIHSYSESNGSMAAEPARQLRRIGLEGFRKMGFPTSRNEDWKYTRVSPFLQESYELKGRILPEEVSDELLQQGRIPSLACYELVLVNGKLKTPLPELPACLKVSTIREAAQHPDMAARIGRLVNLEQAPFAALNTALFTDGILVEMEAGAVLDKPLHLLHLFTADDNLFVQPRHLLIAGKGATLSLIETVVSDGGSARIFVNSLTEVVVEEDAVMEHYLVQTAQSGTRLVQQTDVSQKKHSLYSNYTFSLPGAELIRNTLHVSLDAVQTESHLYGLYLGAGEQLIDNHSLVDHRMPHCNSNEIYKGVLQDQATGVFNGKIFVQRDAQQTNAFQQNNNLLLSDRATINSKPQLEIFADDVKCSHGSTVGQLSADALFYLRSRGIGEVAARALLVRAFVFDVTEKIRIPGLQRHIDQLIGKHIPA